MSSRFSFVISLSTALLASAALAQVPNLPRPNLPRPTPGAQSEGAKPAPPQKRVVDPAEQHQKWADVYFRILRLPKSDFVKLSATRVRSIKLLSGRIFELVGEEGDDYLVRNLSPEDPDAFGHKAWLEKNMREAADIEKRKEYRAEFANAFSVTDLDPNAIVPPFTDKLEFVRKDKGLPRDGRWQMSFDVADMNGDGRPDLVLPPQRLGYAYPSIYFQQADGSWAFGSDLKFPKDVKFDYGAVRVADFDGDGHLDIAIACHFSKTYVLYGNGKGDFSRYVEIPRRNGSVTFRSLAVADFNNDGRPDLAMEDEVDVDMASSQQIGNGLVNVVLNLPSGWKCVNQEFVHELQGDWLTTGDLDGDGWTDLLLTTRKYGVRDLIWRNVDKGERFEAIGSAELPAGAYVFANAVGHFDDSKRPDLVMCFEQFDWQKQGVPPSQTCAIFSFTDAEGKFTPTPTAKPLFLERQPYKTWDAVAVGDLDGDGRDDLVVMNEDGRVRVFLQFPDHTLYEEKSPEIDLTGVEAFDVRIADLDGDGRGEIIICGSPKGPNLPSGVWVFSPKLKAEGGKS